MAAEDEVHDDLFTDAERAVLWRYIEAGAGSSATVRDNEGDWQRWRVVPRAFADVTSVDIGVDLLGHRFDAPIVIAPMLGAGALHPDGELALAAAARELNLPLALSLNASRPVEDVARLAGPFLQQVYLPADRSQLDPVIERVVRAGAIGLLLTVDQPGLAGHGFREGAGSVLARLGTPNVAEPEGMTLATDLRPDDVTRLARISGLPVLVKGVLRPADAVLAVEAGAAGVVVSNHGGRQLDGSVTAAQMLPSVVAAVGSRGLVLADGGIRSGGDAFRALALGADAVLVGRPVLRALAASGVPGVVELLARYVDRLRADLGNAGAPDLSGLDRSFVRHRSSVHESPTEAGP